MNNEIKNYIKYLFKSNMRVMILISVILFVFLPFLTYQQGSFATDYEGRYITIMIIFSCFALLLSTLFPIYIHRLIYKRRSCDLYMGLPIKRRILFRIHFIFGLGMSVVPLFVNYLLSILIYYTSNSIDIACFALGALIVFFFICVNYCIFSLIVTKCNNLFDSIIISIGFICIVFAMYLAIQVFTMSKNYNFVAAYLYGDNLYNPEILFKLFSVPMALLYAFNKMLATLDIVTDSVDFNFLYYIYWAILGIVSYFFAERTYNQRKEEEAETRTTSVLAFPTLIILSTIAMVIILFVSSSFSIILWIIVFMIYMIMNFFAQRKIQITIKSIVIFAVISAVTFGISQAYVSTQGFNLIQEVPSASNVKVLYLEYEFSMDSMVAEELGMDTVKEYAFIEMEVTGSEGNALSYIKYGTEKIFSEDMKELKKNIKLQEDMRNIQLKENRDRDEISINNDDIVYWDYGSVTFHYILNDGKDISRKYSIDKSNELIFFLDTIRENSK